MRDRERYLHELARRLSVWCGKPSAIISAMAFLLLWTVVGVFADVPLAAHVIVNAAISIITLLMVIQLHNAHRQDVHALQARIEELVAARQADDSEPGGLTDSEVLQVRDLLQHRDSKDHGRRANRDRRPSLF